MSVERAQACVLLTTPTVTVTLVHVDIMTRAGLIRQRLLVSATMNKLIATTAAAALIAGGSYAAYDYSQPDDTTIPPSPGVTAETLLHVDQAGAPTALRWPHRRARNKRHGGQGRNHPAADNIENFCWESGASTGAQARTNIRSDGRAGGKALPRRGGGGVIEKVTVAAESVRSPSTSLKAAPTCTRVGVPAGTPTNATADKAGIIPPPTTSKTSAGNPAPPPAAHNPPHSM